MRHATDATSSVSSSKGVGYTTACGALLRNPRHSLLKRKHLWAAENQFAALLRYAIRRRSLIFREIVSVTSVKSIIRQVVKSYLPVHNIYCPDWVFRLTVYLQVRSILDISHQFNDNLTWVKYSRRHHRGQTNWLFPCLISSQKVLG